MFSKKPLCVAGIVTALTWPASLLTVASVIDNPWGVCLHRSAEVGKHLAHILLSRQQVTGRNYPGITARRELAQGGEVLQSCWVHGIFLGRQKLIKQKLTECCMKVTSRYLSGSLGKRRKSQVDQRNPAEICSIKPKAFLNEEEEIQDINDQLLNHVTARPTHLVEVREQEVRLGEKERRIQSFKNIY